LTTEIVITGVGPISAIGIGREDFCGGLTEGRVGIRPAEILDTSALPSKLAAECLDFHIEDYIESEKTYLDRTSAFALAGCQLALEDAGLDARSMDHERIGLSLGTGHGCMKTMHEYYARVAAKGPRFASSVLFPHSYANTPASLVSIEYRIMGPTNTVCTGAVSALSAIAYAFDLLRHDRIDAMLAGGIDSVSQPLLRGLSAQGMLSPADGGEEGARPFDARRNGYVLGEGAGLLVLERADRAEQRGAKPMGKLLGYGLAQGGAEALAAAIRAALEDAAAEPGDIDAVFAAANGSRELDACEAEALQAVLGDGAVPVTSPKSALGESIGASAALSLIAALWAINARTIPPTWGCAEPDTGTAVVAEPTPAELRTCLVSCLDVSGNCGALVVTAP
jgi:3-oxoacyl-[acyl-carrier-protein] synthase II